MLLANMAVAHKIYRSFPEQALLRRHPPPQNKLLNDLIEFCDQMGLQLDFTDSGTLHVSNTQLVFVTDSIVCERSSFHGKLHLHTISGKSNRYFL